MKRQFMQMTLWSVALLGVLWSTQAPVAHGQFTQNKKDTIKVDPAGFPADVHHGYRLFQGKCGECHGLDVSLKPSFSPVQWNSEVKRMQAMASSQFSNEQAISILRFLNYDETHRKLELKPASAVLFPDSITAGSQIYSAQGCDACHSVAGKGGSLGALDGVGSKLSRQQLTERLKVQRQGSSMPPLPAGTSDAQVESLVDYLLTLKQN